MSIVVGTAGHIDHGKTTLLRALTGIDADRLPEERRRGMTIEVGYAHLALSDGTVVDFVDVPGHDRLVGNMLVGAGEIDAALLVVAADDGPNAQTIEHLELLDALGIRDGIVAVTKADAADEGRVADVVEAVGRLVARTSLAGSRVLAVSAITGAGLDGLRDAIADLVGSVGARPATGPRLAVDRVFAVRGRGTVITGSLRGGSVAAGTALRLIPGERELRVREVQVRGDRVDVAAGGRTALLLGSFQDGEVARGQVLTTDRAVAGSSRLLAAVRAPAGLAGAGRPPEPPADRDRLRLHLGTAQAGALVVRGPREAIELEAQGSIAILRLDQELAAAPGDRFALRHPSPGSTAGGGVVLDPQPPRGVSRRRLTPDRAALIAAAVASADSAAIDGARLELHGALVDGSHVRLAPDVDRALQAAAVELVAEHHVAAPASPGLPLPAARSALALAARRLVTLPRAAADQAAGDVLDGLVRDGRLARDGDRLRDPARSPGLPAATLEAMDRLEAALAVAAPPALAEAARAAGCPADGIRALEAAGRIVRLEDDLAWASGSYRDLVKRALAMAAVRPLSPAALRDETGTSRRYVLVILEDLDRRGLLRRTDSGHVLGPQAIARMEARAAASGGTQP